MNIPIYKIALFLLTPLLFACHAEREEQSAELMVSIAPLKYIVEQITCGDFDIEVLVPTGASPETYDPTPRQIKQVEDSKLLFSTGLIEFEQTLLARLKSDNIVDLSQSIDLIAGEHHHKHSHTEEHSHTHGIDPHIWTSPIELRQMAHNAYDAIMQQYPDSVHYTQAYEELVSSLNLLDKECRAMCEASHTKAFVIYHPALSYLARAYTLEQIAIEEEGKEPSARHIAHIIDSARSKGIKCLLYQSQFPRSVVDVIAHDMGIKAQEFDPLKENVIENILYITRCITGNTDIQ